MGQRAWSRAGEQRLRSGAKPWLLGQGVESSPEPVTDLMRL